MKSLRARHPWVASSLALLIVASSLPVSHPAAAAPPPVNCDLWLGVCLGHSLFSQHFSVFYDTTGRFAVTQEWAKNVSTMAEAAYQKLVVEEGFPPPARNPIPIYLDLARGGFTNFLLCVLCPGPGDLQRLQIEYRYKSPCPQDCGIPTSNWEVAHEVFHTIQFTQFGGYPPFGAWLAEGSANWAGYSVVGNESRWDPWVISDWLGPNGTTEKSLDERRYDNAFLLIFLSDHYGGTEIVKRIIANANREERAGEVVVSQLHALGYNKTFAGVMNEFATAMLTGNFTDRDGAGAVLRQLPPIGATTKWTGANQTVSTFTTGVNGFAAGAPLQVEIPGGTEFIRVQPASDATLYIDLRAPDRPCFESAVITRKAGGFATYAVQPSRPVRLLTPDVYNDVFVAVTRGHCSSGQFSVSLNYAPPQGLNLLPLGPELTVFASAIAILLVLVVAAVIFRRRRNPSPNPGS